MEEQVARLPLLEQIRLLREQMVLNREQNDVQFARLWETLQVLHEHPDVTREQQEREGSSAAILRQAALDIENWAIEKAMLWTALHRRQHGIEGFIDFNAWVDDETEEQERQLLREALAQAKFTLGLGPQNDEDLDAIRRAGHGVPHEGLAWQPLDKAAARLRGAVAAFPVRVFDLQSDALVEVPQDAAEGVARLYLAVRAQVQQQ